jgi:hypothetical protein
MLRRMHLAGLPSPTENDGRLTQLTINATCAPDGMALRAGVVQLRYADHLNRYRAKWLGGKGQETTVHPYGIPHLDYTFTGTPPGWKAHA